MHTITRRGFLGSLIGGVAVGASVRSWPFRVFSFPKVIDVAPVLPATSVRFVKVFDPIAQKMINRFDVLYGFANMNMNGGGLALENIRGVEACHTVSALEHRGLTQEEIDYFKEARAKEYGIHILGAPAPATVKNREGSKQIIIGWDVSDD